MRVPAMIGHIPIAMLAAGLIAASPAQAEDNPIDTKLNACLASKDGQSTTGMVDCIGTAITAYDARLNAVYARAMAALDPASRDKLRVAQRQWLAFRKADEEVYGGKWREDRGTIMRVTLSYAALGAIKERVSELEAIAGED